ncbi:hypothetical protein FVB32_01025 [Flagellimonas hymeniacidonis]|uniref:Uncharacterized protein n=1 Tax=Flagellimonas hymeniacidonis TaxID=2603628 RepID=A0A5C8V6K7_9FLAO|nr:hypothetical protein [Flagellimonas hymeniacidonis]TXN36900.1 hypothetical protein FVB32_01025 [Flagellimonas hymeniacidonis]
MEPKSNYDEKTINRLLAEVKNLQEYDVTLIKDSLSDFFVDWVNVSHDTGVLDREIHLSHTHHYSLLQNFLTYILECKKDKLSA